MVCKWDRRPTRLNGEGGEILALNYSRFLAPRLEEFALPATLRNVVRVEKKHFVLHGPVSPTPPALCCLLILCNKERRSLLGFFLGGGWH